MIEINLFFDPIKVYILSLFVCLCTIGEKVYTKYKFNIEEENEDKILIKDILISLTPILNTLYMVLVFCSGMEPIINLIITKTWKKIKSLFQKK